MTQVHRIGFTQLQGKSGTREEGSYRVKFATFAWPDAEPQLTQGSIILVHGLRGHPRHTWESGKIVNTNDDHGPTIKKRTGLRSFFKSKRLTPDPSPSQAQDVSSPPSVFWPDDFLTDDIPEARIWTYGYDADVIGGVFQANNQNSVSQHGRDLKAKLEREINNNDPIVFIVHSLGGIIVKDGCQARAKLIIFLGTPHRGSSYSEWGQIASNLARLALQDSNKKIIEMLEVNSEVLDNIHEEFKTIVHSHNIKVHSFQEARGITGMKGLHNKVVDNFSSKLDLPQSLETVESINANHMEMARCSSKTDERYRAIVGVLRQGVSAMIAPIDRKPVHAVHYVIPFAKNKHYVERTELSDVQRMLFDDTHQTVALVGMGGLGKTQLALNFAYWVKENKPTYSVFWIPALSVASFEQVYTDIAKELGLRPNTKGEDIKTTVRQFLNSKEAGRWLLIIDNADDMELLYGSAGDQDGLIHHLPRSENGITLFTTRSRELALAVAKNALIKLRAMDQGEAEALFRKSILRKQHLQDHDSVAKLLDFLTFLPLAITQASAYLNWNESVPIARYIQLLQGTEQTLISTMSREFRDSTRYPNSPNAIATTWLVSFEQIQQIDSYAANLLYFISRIEPKSIPRSILPRSGSEDKLDNAIGILGSYAFLVERDETETFDMHSLVHLATRIWVTKRSIDAQIKEDAVERIKEIFPTYSYGDRARWREYMPHALKVLNESTEVEMNKKLRLYSRVGWCLLEDGRTKEAVKLLKQAVEVQECTLDEGHPHRLTSQQVLASAYQADGRVEEAIKLLEHVVEVRQSTLDKGHPHRLTSQQVLASAYQADGRVEEAIKLLEHVVEVRQSTLDEGHPDRLASQQVLASAYQADGRVEEAIKLLEHVVEVQQSTLDEGHPHRLASQQVLASAYQADGRVEEAIKLLEHVVEVEASILDEGHPDRLTSQQVLASAYQADGRVEEAIKLLEHVVEVRQSTLDKGHPHRLTSQHELARAYQADGRVEEAIKLLEHVVEVRQSTLDKGHPDRLASQQVLASAYQADGRVEEAIKLLEHVVEVQQSTLDEGHPHRLTSQHELARAYQADGRVEEAIKLLEHVVEVRQSTLDKGHPHRLTSQHELARAYQADGRVEEAIKLLEHVVEVQQSTLDEGHPHRLASQQVLASAYQADGRVEEAIKLLEHVVEVEASILDEGHPDRLTSQQVLASAYQADGRVEEAIKLLEHVVEVQQSTLDEGHPHRLTSQHELARAYQADGRVEEAIKLLEHVVEVRQSTLDEGHPDRLASQQVLASAYQADGRVEEAIKLLEHVVEVEASILDEGHPDRLTSQQVLASAYQEDGRG
ncbi:hypothetical protein BDP81DRAFT_473894 [Colletotrichum phormii]|uniref:NB-ARC domain-containing protein n=1 Tax=Colletotrichum phormii TaxID=359342 RepID=A0AAJ0EBP3_9PEZI|nr:uncharacterized protein BDP81DRAFT_473894 [Colletotrichum phormii]KAK1633204.1 hypothetical protein BDP81DRAFT_473894 [Colletotrichum phormii]